MLLMILNISAKPSVYKFIAENQWMHLKHVLIYDCGSNRNSKYKLFFTDKHNLHQPKYTLPRIWPKPRHILHIHIYQVELLQT